MINLFEYQKEALKFHLKNKYSICALRMGYGKTLVALSLVERVEKKTLIIVPAFLVKNWQDEIKKYCPQIEPLIKVYSYTQLKKIDTKMEANIIILDEFHYVKNRKAERTKLALSIVKKINPEYFLGLSGTPVKNYIHEFWAILKFIHLGGQLKGFDVYASSFWRFALRFCVSSERFISGRKVVEFGGAQNVSELKDILKDCMFRKKADVLDLPPSIHKNFVISDKAKTDAALKRAYEIYDSGKLIGEESFTETKTINALSKVDFTCELAEQILEEESHIIIFTDHVDSCMGICEKLKGTFITGKVPMNIRMNKIDEWKRDGGALVGTFGSMGTGLNLTEAKFMILNDYPWVGSDLLQALKRTMRIGQKSTCYYYSVFSSPMDEYIYEKVIAKSKAIKEVLT